MQEAAPLLEEPPAFSTTLPVYVMLPLDTVWLLERDGKRVRARAVRPAALTQRMPLHAGGTSLPSVTADSFGVLSYLPSGHRAQA